MYFSVRANGYISDFGLGGKKCQLDGIPFVSYWVMKISYSQYPGRVDRIVDIFVIRVHQEL